MSFKPSKAVEGGGIDFDGTIIAFKTGTFDYRGKAEPQTGVLLTIRNDDVDEGDPHRFREAEFFSAGKTKQILPNDAATGFKSARPDKEYAGLNKRSVAYLLFEEVVKAGFPEELMHVNGDENNGKFLEGQRFHFALKDRETQGGEKKASLLPTKYLGAAQGDLLKGVGAAPATSAGAASPAASSSGVDFKVITHGLIIEVLSETEGNKIPKSKLSPSVLKKVTDPATKGGVVKLLVDDTFLKGLEGVKYDGKELSL